MVRRLLMVLLETALITPPIGINLYVVQGIRKKGGLNDVMIGTLPFVCHVRHDRPVAGVSRSGALAYLNFSINPVRFTMSD